METDKIYEFKFAFSGIKVNSVRNISLLYVKKEIQLIVEYTCLMQVPQE